MTQLAVVVQQPTVASPSTSPSLDTPPSRTITSGSGGGGGRIAVPQPDSDDSSLNSIELDSLHHHHLHHLHGQGGSTRIAGSGRMMGSGNSGGSGSVGNNQAGQPPRPPTEDSDTGMESLSSAETPATTKRIIGGGSGGSGSGGGKSCTCYADEPSDPITLDHVDDEEQQLLTARQNELLQQEVNKLKCDKLELLRQNVVRLSDSIKKATLIHF